MKSIFKLLAPIALILGLAQFCPAQQINTGGNRRVFGVNCAIAGCSDSFAGTSLSSNWTVTSGTFQVASGQVNAFNNSAESYALWNKGTFSGTTQHSCATIGANTGGARIGVAVRATTDGNGYYLWFDTGVGMVFGKMIANASTQLNVFSSTPTTGQVVCLAVSGTTFTVTVNGTSLGTFSDSTYVTGAPGLYADGSGAGADTLSSWTGGN